MRRSVSLYKAPRIGGLIVDDGEEKDVAPRTVPCHKPCLGTVWGFPRVPQTVPGAKARFGIRGDCPELCPIAHSSGHAGDLVPYCALGRSLVF